MFREHFQSIRPSEGLTPLRIGLDMFSLVYTHRAHLKDLLELLKSWASVGGHEITCVWDGTHIAHAFLHSVILYAWLYSHTIF